MLTMRTALNLPKLSALSDIAKNLLANIALSLIFVASSYAAAAPTDPLRQLLQLAEYVGVDYASAVVDGEISDPGEYQEMVEFSGIILEKSQRLLADKPTISTLAQSLQLAIKHKQNLSVIQGLSSRIRTELLALPLQLSLPKTLLSKSSTQQLFQSHYASCHGLTGNGHGPLALQLQSLPTNFGDKSRAVNRSILGLYNAISDGLEGTAMQAFVTLSDQQRWSLAFFTGSLAFKDNYSPRNETKISRQDLVMYSPAELNRKSDADIMLELEQARSKPALLFVQQSPLSITRQRLKEASLAHHRGDYDNSSNLAVSAYLDGFELMENSLDTRNETLRKSIELKLLTLRRQLNSQHSDQQVDQSIKVVLAELQQAELLLNEHAMSTRALFSAAFIFLLREGLEALLVVIALTTVLLRAKKKQALKYVHFGWVSALAAGGLTWFAAQYLITISGASREVMEGVAALLASAALFYVSFWMHSKTQADQWQSYIQRNIDRNLKAGTLWGIAALAFITVYREVFETVLFYQSLLSQTNASQQQILVAGFGLALLALITVAWLMNKYSVKLPIGKFFGSTTYLLLALSFVLAGKAISALQEAALVAINPFPIMFQVEWLGINSTWQGLGLQLSILVLSSVLVTKTFTQNSRQESKDPLPEFENN